MKCPQELCGNWSGDGLVCPCALFDLEPDLAEMDQGGPPLSLWSPQPWEL